MLKHKNQAGFTMIEVMIVLAIAAIFLVGVLVAAQAFQRAGRNHQRAADARFVLATVNEYQSQTGQTPTDIKPFISKLEEGLSYYYPTPGAISPEQIIYIGAGTTEASLKSTAYFVNGSQFYPPRFNEYHGRVWQTSNNIITGEITFKTPNATTWDSTCTMGESKTKGWPACSRAATGTPYVSNPNATEFIGIFSSAECLKQNNIIVAGNKRQIAILYKLEGTDSAQCIDI